MSGCDMDVIVILFPRRRRGDGSHVIMRVVVMAHDINSVAVMVGHDLAVLRGVMIVVIGVMIMGVIRSADDLGVDDVTGVLVDNRNDLASWLDFVGVIRHSGKVANDFD